VQFAPCFEEILNTALPSQSGKNPSKPMLQYGNHFKRLAWQEPLHTMGTPITAWQEPLQANASIWESL
jgi:hypothetical protein